MAIVGERLDDVVLAVKVAVDGAVTHARAADDLGHADLVKSILGETRQRGLEDVQTARLATGLADFRHVNLSK
jgi:polyhydroxyalkanoate synthesis regulator protein